MSTFSKEWEYKGYEFKTTVELYTEYTIDDVRHTIKTFCDTANDYFAKDSVQTHVLDKIIIEQRKDAMKYIDKLTNTPSTEEAILLELGFTETK